MAARLERVFFRARGRLTALLVFLLLLAVPSAVPASLNETGEREAKVAWLKGVAANHLWLGIPREIAASTRLRIQPEPSRLVSVGRGIYGRQHRLAPEAALAFEIMRQHARDQGVSLLLVSSYRSVDYQAELVARRLEEGRDKLRIFHGLALPGYSEHHSGCAVDLATDDYRQLGQDFRETAAYAWLRANARDYGFRESYPRNNNQGIMPEPWHWYFFACAR
ncbi:M15 family metallopeptidase [Gammaproteobacteria bacterium AB-CW1]|uniref:M15 family metallopeptidase n=1 Tax=Natronospira elongata TaxID=3110268 RepID=A0AAP6MLB9_9GAMM|nr:M15 family metallopeptidase [Gammaproteobacteria bacterium AB-CW1]